MNEFLNKYNDFLYVFNNGKTMVLSSCEDNKVSSRMMSIVCIKGKFYFQTDMSFRKYRELIHNPYVALCIDNIQIEGVCKEIGHPMDNTKFCSEYEKHLSIEHKGLHSLIHTFATNLINGIKQPDGTIKSLTPRQVGDLLGHSTSQITEMYYAKRDNSRLVGITDNFEF